VALMAKDIAPIRPTHFVLPAFGMQTDFETVNDRVDGLRKLTIIGFSITSVFFAGLLGWAYNAELASAAMAPGVVKVASDRKTIQHLEGGIVKQILVRNGDRVAAGQTLIRLDGTKTRSTLEQLRGQKLAALALIARLSAERDDVDRVVFTSELLSHRGDPKVESLLRVQRDIFEARRTSVKTKSKIIAQRINQFKKEIEGLQAQILSDSTQLGLISREMRGVKKLYEKKLIPIVRLLSLQRDLAKIKGARAGRQSQIARVKQKIAESQLMVVDLHESRRKEAVQELRAANAQLNEAVEQIPVLDDRLRRLDVRAPIDGNVVEMQLHTKDGVIRPGDTIMQIVPEGDVLVIEAKVSPTDIDVVHPGLKAQVRLSALSRRKYPPLEARVLWVSADQATAGPETAPHYLIRLEILDSPSKKQYGDKLYPGMLSSVTILTEQETLLQILLDPLKRIQWRALREG
jgi:HlyD family type I secretion membrane fusion protein